MKKLATILGSIICLSIMKQPKSKPMVKTINNTYFINPPKTGGCNGSCGGKCSCGTH